MSTEHTITTAEKDVAAAPNATLGRAERHA